MTGRYLAIITLHAALLVSACESATEIAPPTTVTVSASPTITATAPTSSGNPLYDRYAAALTAAGIKFDPNIQYGTFDTDTRICGWMRDGTMDAHQIAWSEGVAEHSENGRRVALMIPLLCPDQQHVLDDALGPNPTMRKFQSGKHFVGYGKTELGHPRVHPGTYRTGTVSDCYWERLDGQGNIIENNMVSLSESVVVTIAESDAAFNARGCGQWTLVG